MPQDPIYDPAIFRITPVQYQSFARISLKVQNTRIVENEDQTLCVAVLLTPEAATELAMALLHHSLEAQETLEKRLELSTEEPPCSTV